MGLLDGLLGALLGGGQAAQTGRGGLEGLGGLLAGQSRAQGGGADLMAALLPVVLAMMQNRGGGGGGLGGLGGLLRQFEGAGFDRQVSSWVGTGENMAISPDDLINALGRGRVSAMAAQAGISEEQASTGLATMLPELVNQLTPAGQMPTDNEVDDALGGLQRSLGI